MSFRAGQTTGHYRIVAPIGAGGMGEVFRATDTRLGRDVAIKILPAAVMADPERLARFRREATLLASLNHPNIAAIHGFEEAEGTPFLVLELVEGEDLARRLERGPVPMDEALSLARQIAEGLEEAHEKGIVHRDLKPANVRVTPDGKVKLLDFGLAKAFAGEPADATAMSDHSRSPTVTTPMGTHAGVILGTAAYMSPEQARGRAVDRRADIWAFGVVIWELLTGRMLFGGETVTDILAAVLTRPADLERLPAGTPPALRRLLARCLERDPKKRLRDIGEARLVLEGMADGPGEPAAETDDTRRRGARRAVIAAAALCLALGALGGWLAGRSGSSGRPTSGEAAFRMSLAAPAGARALWSPALAPDGSFVVYVSDGGGEPGLYLQRFDEFRPRRIAGTDGAWSPALSPDGRSVAFFQGRALRRVALAGGDVMTICRIEHTTPPGIAWRADNTLVFPTGWLAGLSVVAADGGEPRGLTALDPEQGEKGHWWPRILPDGRNALITLWLAKAGLNDAKIALLDLSTGRYRVLLTGADGRFLPPGHIVYYRGGAYHAVSFDPRRLEVTGEPVPVLDDADDLVPEGDKYMPFDVSADGAMVYTTSRASGESRLAWVAPGVDPELLRFPARVYRGGSLSSDGRTLALTGFEEGVARILLMDLQRGTERRLDLQGGTWFPRWNPRDATLAVLSMRKGDFDIYLVDPLAGKESPLVVEGDDETPIAWTPDGSALLYSTSDPENHKMGREISADGRRLRDLTIGDTNEDLVFHPKGGWVGFSSDRTGRDEVFVQAWPGPGAAEQVSLGGGRCPRWSGSGEELYFVRGDAIVALPIRSDAGRLAPGAERVIVEAPLASGADPLLAVDGQRFLVRLRAGVAGPPQLRLARRWDLEVARKALPSGR